MELPDGWAWVQHGYPSCGPAGRNLDIDGWFLYDETGKERCRVECWSPGEHCVRHVVMCNEERVGEWRSLDEAKTAAEACAISNT